jgi:DNA-binding transcriptional MerR regulator/effector-binding domain-containing protein
MPSPASYCRNVDKDGLIPIGRFAKLTDLSPRFLRKLDERGVLTPVLVDPDTQYRYYSVSQTRTAALIHLCRQLDVPPDEIEQLVEAADRGELRAHLERHRGRLTERITHQVRLLRLLDQELERSEPPLAFDIALKDIPELLVMSAMGEVPRAHPHDAWALEAALRRVGAQAMLQIARSGEEPDPRPLILYHTDLGADDILGFEVCFPVRTPLPECPGVRCRRLPAARVAFTTFRGPYDTIWYAYVELDAWVTENHFAVAGSHRELGIVTDVDTPDSRAWVTEVAVPVTPLSK